MRDNRVKEALNTLTAAGYVPRLEHGKHIKIKWTARSGKNEMLVLSATPSDVSGGRDRNRTILQRLMATDISPISMAA